MPLTRIRGSVLCKIQLILSAKLFIGHFLFEFLLLFQLFCRENDSFYETCQIFKEFSTNFSFVCFELDKTQFILITNCSLDTFCLNFYFFSNFSTEKMTHFTKLVRFSKNVPQIFLSFVLS